MSVAKQSQFGFLPQPLATAAGSSSVGLRGDVQYVAPMHLVDVTTEVTAANVTHLASEILGGVILRDCAGGARTDTFPTTELLLAAYKGAVVGSSVRVIIRNISDAAETITMAVGAGMTDYASNTKTIAQNKTGEYMIVFTSVTVGAAACTLYTISSAGTQ